MEGPGVGEKEQERKGMKGSGKTNGLLERQGEAGLLDGKRREGKRRQKRRESRRRGDEAAVPRPPRRGICPATTSSEQELVYPRSGAGCPGWCSAHSRCCC